MVSGGGDGRDAPTGIRPGALTDLLRHVAAAPAGPEDEPAPLLPGAVIGRFEIVRELSRGGFGVVYEARDRELGRQVALKLVRHGAASAEGGKVAREAEAIARLTHPNLITLHDVGRSEHGPYLVFELLRGKTLQERLDDGPLPLQEAVHIAVEVARGLAHAHAEGVVHRDLKPSNVFVTAKGQVKILDFGMAHAFGRRRLSGGTPAYMAPEQCEDEPEDERTDVFALGVMLHVMLSGQYPFPEGDGRWSAGPDTAPALELPGAPGLSALIDRMLEKAPKGRPRDGAAVLAALTPIEEALRSKPAHGSPPSHAKRRKATLRQRLSGVSRRRLLGAAAVVGLVASLAAPDCYIVRQGSGNRAVPSPEAQPSIAVLPFADMSEKHDQEYFADGVAEEILNALARIDGLKVVGRTSSFSFKGKKEDLRSIGEKLGVTTILEGSLRTDGRQLRITAKLVRAADGVQLWSESSDRKLSGIFKVQDEIAGAVAKALQLRLLPAARAAPRSHDPDAYASYLLGRQLLSRMTHEELPRAIASFEKAVSLDPAFAEAWAGLSHALDERSGWQSSLEGILRDKRKALDAANRAVELAPGAGAGYAARAQLVDIRGWDWQGSIADARRAVELDPGDVQARIVLGGMLSGTGNGAATQELRRATELDPLSALAWSLLGLAANLAGDRELGTAAHARAREINPRNDWRTLVGEGSKEWAEAVLREPVEALDPVIRAARVQAFRFLGREAAARAELDELISCCSFTGAWQIAFTYERAGERDKAFEWLERARLHMDGGIRNLKLAQRYKGDPRTAEILKKMNLPLD